MDQSSLISNKIITADNLRSVFAEINNCLAKTQQQFEAEVARNRDLPRNLQSWSMQFFRATLNATITFSDRTKRSYDNYHDFIDDFNHRPGSIKSIFLFASVQYTDSRNYNPASGTARHHINARLDLFVHEDSLSIHYEDKGGSHALDSAYILLQSTISQAPERYDRTVRSRNFINTKIGFAMVAIPIAILMALLGVIPTMRLIYAHTYVLYPLATLSIAVIAGTFIGANRTERFYRSLLPRQRYKRYNRNNHQPVYSYDIADYTEKGEVLIGRNVDNLRHRRSIQTLEKKSSTVIPVCLAIIVILSIAVVVLGKVWPS